MTFTTYVIYLMSEQLTACGCVKSTTFGILAAGNREVFVVVGVLCDVLGTDV